MSGVSTGVIDGRSLAGYLRQQGLCQAGEVQFKPLSGGQSNPTYLVAAGSWHGVLRTRPAGQLVASAHAIDREYEVMRALQDSAVPVPRMLAYCDDASILGRDFYLMEYVQGRVFMDPSLPGLTPRERSAIYAEMNRVIAALHALDYHAVGLAGFGKPGNYFSRQIARWSRQCRESRLPVGRPMQALMEWLPEHIPADDETTLVHGDYRLDNLVFHPTEPRVLAVLDWELSTLGHPLADLAYQCMGWHIPATLWRGVGGLDLPALGIPGEADYVRAYETTTGRAAGAHWRYYIAYNLFRMAAILHGIGERALEGNAAAADAVETGRKAQPLAEIGWACAQRYEAERR